VRTIVLFTANFSPLAGILSTGYYLHTCAVPILRNAKYPEHNTRNLFIGYTFVFLSYVIIGGLGYQAFIGTEFKNYFVRNLLTQYSGNINQNCLNMFGYTSTIAFLIRLAIFMLLFATYPMLNLFLRTHLLNIFF
jgi:sodium-coupled neutral amino acid transporter 9